MKSLFNLAHVSLLIFLFSLWGGFNAAAQENDKLFLQASSHRSLNAAIDAATLYAPNFPNTEVYSSQSGYYAVVLGKFIKSKIDPILEELRRNRTVPNDAFASAGGNFTKLVWQASNEPPAAPALSESKALYDDGNWRVYIEQDDEGNYKCSNTLWNTGNITSGLILIAKSDGRIGIGIYQPFEDREFGSAGFTLQIDNHAPKWGTADFYKNSTGFYMEPNEGGEDLIHGIKYGLTLTFELDKAGSPLFKFDLTGSRKAMTVFETCIDRITQ